MLMLQVFCDNYLDGGYHVPYAHKGLASGIQLESYSSEVCLIVFPLFCFPILRLLSRSQACSSI